MSTKTNNMMRTKLFLHPAAPHEAGCTEAGALCLMYMSLLHEYGQDHYKQISIYEGMTESVVRTGKHVCVKLKYDSERRDVEKNRIRLEIIHAALLRVAVFENKLDLQVLDRIRQRILESEFMLEIVYRKERRKDGTVAKIVVHPEMEWFDYYVVVEERGVESFKLWIHSGEPDVEEMAALFATMEWKNNNELVIIRQSLEAEIRVFVKERRAAYKELMGFVRLGKMRVGMAV